MASIFTRIINREIPCHLIAETEAYIAFLDVRPLAKGHTLVIPKAEIDYVFDLPDDTLQGVMVFSKKVAQAIKSVINCEKIGVAVIGLEVAHAHIHLVPIRAVGDINFSNPKLELSTEELAAIAMNIRSAYEQIHGSQTV
jgi:histidine triad (HIT) family protein